MSWRLTFTSIFLVSIFLTGWFAFNGQPVNAQIQAAGPNRDLAAFGSIFAQAATTAPPTTAGATPTPVPPTATPIPVTPTPTPGAAPANTGTGLPVVPIFLGIMFLGLVLAVTLPMIRARLGRRK